MTYLGVLLLTMLFDLFSTLKVIAIHRRRPLLAGTYSALDALVGIAGTLIVIKDPSTIFAAMAGYFIGTWAAAKWGSKK